MATKTITKFYDDGTLKVVYTVSEHGKKEGPYESQDEKGQLKEKATYKDGMQIANKKYTRERRALLAGLASLDKQMKPTQLRQDAKRDLVAEYRRRFPKASKGRD
ncbi:MAG: hypothetical protein ACI4OR_04010 [Alphaproteobacteria bacterium]